MPVRRLLTLAFAASALSAAGAISLAEAVNVDSPPFRVNGGVSPLALPRHSRVPVTFTIEGRSSRTPGADLAALTEMQVDFDRNGAVDSHGPACGRRQLEEPGCARAKVGSGVAHLEASSGPTSLPLTLYNGGSQGGAATLFVTSPRVAGAPVATVKFQSIHDRRYGLRATVKILPLSRNLGPLRYFRLTLPRQLRSGEIDGYVMARCPDGRLSAELVDYTLSDGRTFSGEPIDRTCVRGA